MTPNGVVAANIQRLRKELGLSRKALADHIGWSEHKILDLEHGRDRRPGITPDELYVLGVALEATVFELLIPEAGIDQVDLPTDLVPQYAELAIPSVTASQYVESLFGMSAKLLTPERLDRMIDRLAYGQVRRGILAQHPLARQFIDPWMEAYGQHWGFLYHAIISSRDLGWTGDVTQAEAAEQVREVYSISVPMELEDARAEEAKLRRLLDEATDHGVLEVERLIAAGVLPEPPKPDDPHEALDDVDVLMALVDEWLTQIETKEKK